jgi:hypothetical protein
VIPPLPPGDYVIEFGGGISSIGFSVNVIYLVTVE